MAEPLAISVQPTPNPNAAKFTLNRIVSTQGKTFRLPAPPVGGAQAGDAATTDVAWATQLLKIAGVTQVFALNNFISVTKASDADWDAIAPEIERVLTQAFA